MTLRKSLLLLISAVWLLPSISAQNRATSEIRQKADQSTCSNIVALSGRVDINCSSLTPEQAKLLARIPGILNRILANQPDPELLMRKLDEILAAQQKLRPPKAVIEVNSLEHVGNLEIRNLSYGSKAIHLDFMIDLRNTGNVPATNVAFANRLVFERTILGEKLDIIALEQAICGNIQMFRTQHTINEQTLGPGEIPNLLAAYEIVAADLTDKARFHVMDQGPFMEPIIVGCVDYRFGQSPEHHQTGYAFNIYRKEANFYNFLYFGQNLGADDLVFVPYVGVSSISN
ncbi:MAG: hypothetical protein ABR991_02285 [Terracidiphilus sp.]|jgi:hypothetical protein